MIPMRKIKKTGLLLVFYSCLSAGVTFLLTYKDHSQTTRRSAMTATQIGKSDVRHIQNDTGFRRGGAAEMYARNGLIVIASFDVTYAPMALNLYLTSFKKFNIENHLFVSSDSLGCAKLEPYGAHCVQYLDMKKAKGPSIYDSLDYNIKACIKPRIVLDYLKSGFDVLLVDLDIVFLKDPLPFLQQCPDCDLIAQLDSKYRQVNSGFFLVRQTKGGIRLFQKVVSMIPKNPVGDQVYINMAIKNLKHRIQIQHLSVTQFPLGDVFFSEGHRMFIGDNPCSECVIVHNNYIVSVEAKSYRFKEYGLWEVDEGGYYSDKDRKYLKYDNPIDFTGSEIYDTNTMELESLKTALVIGRLLNRTVIMPQFHCEGARRYNPLPGQMCHFGVHFAVRRFESVLPMLTTYREHVFLNHRLVPKSIKQSLSEPYLIDGPIWRNSKFDVSSFARSVKVLTPKVSSAVSSSEIKEWFSKESAKILVFHSLYNQLKKNDSEIGNHLKVINRAIKRSDFIQLTQ